MNEVERFNQYPSYPPFSWIELQWNSFFLLWKQAVDRIEKVYNVDQYNIAIEPSRMKSFFYLKKEKNCPL